MNGMIKMIAAVCRKPGMTHAEYLRYLRDVHGQLTLDNPATLKRYVQNHVFDGAFGAPSEAAHAMVVSRDSATELFWDSPEDMRATFMNEYVRSKVGPDARNFADESVTISIVAEEVDLAVAQPGPGAFKVMHFLKSVPELPVAAFLERWNRAHELAAALPDMKTGLRLCVHNRQLPEFNGMLAYFGGNKVPLYEGMSSLWFDDMGSEPAFRQYERMLRGINADADTRFFDESQSFFVYATEVRIYERVNDQIDV